MKLKDDEVKADETNMLLKKQKKLVFIRHAESMNNVYSKKACDALLDMLSFKKNPVSGLCTIFHCIWKIMQYGENPPLSELGRKQAQEIGKHFSENNILAGDHANITIAHSALSRAVDTCRSIFDQYNLERPYLTLESINEATFLEHIVPFPMDYRITKFRKWIQNCESDIIYVVGHGQYFRRFLKMSESFGNCDCYEITLDVFQSTIEFGEVNRLYASPLAYVHPLNNLMRRVGLKCEELSKKENIMKDDPIR